MGYLKHHLWPHPSRLGSAKGRDAMLKHLPFVLNGGSLIGFEGHGLGSMYYSRLTVVNWWLIGG